jgi:dTDP-4-dehydrorhamnose reductase
VRNGKAGTPIRVVNDVRMSPTYALDAAKALEWLLRHGETGVFHLANAGSGSWFEFAQSILELVGVPAWPEAITSREYPPSRATRPKDSSLRCTRHPPEARALLRPWQDALASYCRRGTA